MTSSIYVSELSATRHVFHKYHFCRGNTSKRKTRLGLIVKGSGSYLYLDKRLKVCEGDVVFIPESIYCYSEWLGTPEIEVVYLNCFMHYDGFCYEPQVIACDEEIKERILQIAALLSTDRQEDTFEAYAQLYRLLQPLLRQMIPGDVTIDRTLQKAVEYITGRWDRRLSVAELAKECCVSESSLYHLFQRKLGQTPIRLLNSIRINVAIEQLENTDCSIAAVSRLCGFASENHFRKVFRELTGTTPLRYRRGTVSRH